MSENTDGSQSVLPEFSQLLGRASRALGSMPNGPLLDEHRRALLDLIEFIREYDANIIASLEGH